MGGEGIKQTLMDKAGPLPIWAWAGIGTVGLAVILHKRTAKTAATTDSTGTTTGTTSTATGGIDQIEQIPVIVGTTSAASTTQRKGANPPQATTPTGTPSPITKANPPVVAKAPTPTVAKVPQPAKSTTITYAIRSGDTLTSIAKRYGLDPGALYAANKATIDSTAKARNPALTPGPGTSSSQTGWWIFPGEKLTIAAHS